MSGIRIARFGGFVNAYLVDKNDGMTLIDTTFGRGATKAILAEATRPIVRIVLTHAHQDHVGGLDALAAELPDAEVLMSARDADAAHARSSSATHSMCGVWGNMSTGRTCFSVQPASTSCAAFGASVVGLQET